MGHDPIQVGYFASGSWFPQGMCSELVNVLEVACLSSDLFASGAWSRIINQPF